MKEIFGHVLFAGTRVLIGLTMAFAHGLGKIPPSEGLINFISSKGFPMALLLAWGTGVIELVGGILLAIGLFSRAIGFSWVIVMLNAAFIMHDADPFAKKELALLYMSFGLIFLSQGGGRYSIDTLIKKRNS
jgi:putative oxidoreductase